MFRGRIRRMVGLGVASLASLGVVVAMSATPAFASTHECEHSHPVCIGAPSLLDGDQVKETSTGRTLNIVHSPIGPYDNAYKLQFTADTSQCVLADIANNVNVIVGGCAASGDVWILDTTSGGNHRWENYYELTHSGGPEFITGCGSTCYYILGTDGVGVQVFEGSI